MKVHAIGTAPVKCTAFRNVERARFTRHGIPGDRAFMLLDEHGQPMPAHHRGHFMPLAFSWDVDGGTLAMEGPDGLAHSAPLELAESITEVDLHGLRTLALRKVLGPWDDLLTDFTGIPTRLYRCEVPGAGIDVLPVTLITTGALAELEARIGSPVDPRRFRANLIIAHDGNGADEDGWDGLLLRVGHVLLKVRSPVPRCIVTQFDPASGRNDMETMKTLGQYRPLARLPDNMMPSYATPGFASYAEVIEEGDIAVGDPVRFA